MSLLSQTVPSPPVSLCDMCGWPGAPCTLLTARQIHRGSQVGPPGCSPSRGPAPTIRACSPWGSQCLCWDHRAPVSCGVLAYAFPPVGSAWASPRVLCHVVLAHQLLLGAQYGKNATCSQTKAFWKPQRGLTGPLSGGRQPLWGWGQVTWLGCRGRGKVTVDCSGLGAHGGPTVKETGKKAAVCPPPQQIES